MGRSRRKSGIEEGLEIHKSPSSIKQPGLGGAWSGVIDLSDIYLQGVCFTMRLEAPIMELPTHTPFPSETALCHVPRAPFSGGFPFLFVVVLRGLLVKGEVFDACAELQPIVSSFLRLRGEWA